MRISDWSSDVCSSDLRAIKPPVSAAQTRQYFIGDGVGVARDIVDRLVRADQFGRRAGKKQEGRNVGHIDDTAVPRDSPGARSADAADEAGAAPGQASPPALPLAAGRRRHPAVTPRTEHPAQATT